jgi:hypothetical protein
MPSFHSYSPSRPSVMTELYSSATDEVQNQRARWRDQSHKMVEGRLESNEIKDAYRLLNGNPPGKEARLQRHRSRSHEELEGGVMTSRAGADYVKQRLAERVREYDVRKTAAFGTEAIPPTPAKAPIGSQSYQQLQDSFTSVLDAIQTGSTDNLIPPIKAVLGKLYELGPELRVEELAQFSRIAEQAVFNMVTLLEQPSISLGAGKKQVLKNGIQNMRRVERLLEKLAKPRLQNLSVDERRLVLQRERGSELGLAAEQAEKIPVQTTATSQGVFTPSPMGSAETNVESLRRLYPAMFDGVAPGSEEEKTLVAQFLAQPIEQAEAPAGVRSNAPGPTQPVQLGRGKKKKEKIEDRVSNASKMLDALRKAVNSKKKKF